MSLFPTTVSLHSHKLKRIPYAVAHLHEQTLQNPKPGSAYFPLSFLLETIACILLNELLCINQA